MSAWPTKVLAMPLRFMPLRSLARAFGHGAMGFCYHAVSDTPLPHVQHLYRFKTQAQFERDLEFILTTFNVVGYEDLLTGYGSRANGRPSAIITFDDGLAECHTVIRPLLLRYGIPAVFFITTDFLDNHELYRRHTLSLCVDAWRHLEEVQARALGCELSALLEARGHPDLNTPGQLLRGALEDQSAIDIACGLLGVDTTRYLKEAVPYLSSAQVRDLAADGFIIGAHGTTHTHLQSLSEDGSRGEILTSCEAISALVGAAEVPFAFPFNGDGVSREMLGALRMSHKVVGRFFDTRLHARDRELITARIVADAPSSAHSTETNLPMHVRRAYAGAIGHALIGGWV